MISASSARWGGGAEDGDKTGGPPGVSRLPWHSVVVYLTVDLDQSFCALPNRKSLGDLWKLPDIEQVN
jgi:hypothetical protein